MGQQLTKILDRALHRNGYDSRRQLDPDQLREHLRPLYVDMLDEIGYTSSIQLDPIMVDAVHTMMRKKADTTGIDYVENTISAKAFILGLWLACVSETFNVVFVLAPPFSPALTDSASNF